MGDGRYDEDDNAQQTSEYELPSSTQQVENEDPYPKLGFETGRNRKHDSRRGVVPLAGKIDRQKTARDSDRSGIGHMDRRVEWTKCQCKSDDEPGLIRGRWESPYSG